MPSPPRRGTSGWARASRSTRRPDRPTAVVGDYSRVTRFYDRLQVFKRAASLGGTESLISLPVLTSQYGHTDEQLKAAGVTRGMARLSVGIEDFEDLKSDLEQALS